MSSAVPFSALRTCVTIEGVERATSAVKASSVSALTNEPSSKIEAMGETMLPCMSGACRMCTNASSSVEVACPGALE